MIRLADFLYTYRLYRLGGHSILYSLRIAFGCAYYGKPF